MDLVGWAPKSVKYASSLVAYFRCPLFALAISLLIIFVCVLSVVCHVFVPFVCDNLDNSSIKAHNKLLFSSAFLCLCLFELHFNYV